MSNQIKAIAPYWHDDIETWVFDDESVGLNQEPFVQGVPEMIDDLTKDIENAKSGFRLIFSAEAFPGYQRRLDFVAPEMGGAWYDEAESNLRGWLCPALFRYFDRPPKAIYVKAESKRG